MDAWWQIAWRFIGFGLVLSIPGLLIGFWLKKTGRGPNLWYLVLIGCMATSALVEFGWRARAPFAHPTVLDYLWTGAAAILASTFVLYWPVRRWDEKK